ncbi:MAG: alpha/beta fold hydrolase [Planctomycetota bacterium]
MNPLRVILISGWASDSHMWEALVPSLEPVAQLSCVEWWECLCGDERAALVSELCHTGAPAVCIGWSLGGLLAMRAALARPHRVGALVLMSATSRMTADEGYPGVAPQALKAMRRRLAHSPEAVLHDFWAACLAPAEDPAAVEIMSRRSATVGGDRLLAGLKYLEQEDLRPSLHRLTMPALVLHGDKDGVIPHASGARLAELLPRGDLVTLPGHGHALLHSPPALIAKAIRSFFSGLLAG